MQPVGRRATNAWYTDGPLFERQLRGSKQAHPIAPFGPPPPGRGSWGRSERRCAASGAHLPARCALRDAFFSGNWESQWTSLAEARHPEMMSKAFGSMVASMLVQSCCLGNCIHPLTVQGYLTKKSTKLGCPKWNHQGCCNQGC